MPRRLQAGLGASSQYIGLQRIGGRSAPCNAGDEVVGDCEKVSRSRRMDEDCFKAELNSEFCSCQRCKAIAGKCNIPCCECPV